MIGTLTTRKNKHVGYLFESIRILHNSIVQVTLESARDGRIDTKTLKRKAALIRKYNRRLNLLKK